MNQHMNLISNTDYFVHTCEVIKHVPLRLRLELEGAKAPPVILEEPRRRLLRLILTSAADSASPLMAEEKFFTACVLNRLLMVSKQILEADCKGASIKKINYVLINQD